MKVYTGILLTTMLLVGCKGAGPNGSGQVASADASPSKDEIARLIAEQRVDGLCAHSEQIVFQCIAGRERIAVCGGSLAGQTYLQFRQQSGGALVNYPESLPSIQPLFSIESPWRTMGGEEHLTFVRGGLQYDVYSVMVGASAEGHGEADVRDGLTISSGERLTSDVRCTKTEVPLDAATAEKLGAARAD